MICLTSQLKRWRKRFQFERVPTRRAAPISFFVHTLHFGEIKTAGWNADESNATRMEKKSIAALKPRGSRSTQLFVFKINKLAPDE